LPWQKRNPD